jgi:septum formation protein
MTSRSSTHSFLSEALPLWLASGSPRRREILATIGVPLVVHAVTVDESTRPNESPDAYLERIVRTKLSAAAQALNAERPPFAGRPLGAIAVADTSVIEGGAVLGKPSDPDDAARMVARLSGRTHEVWTRFAIALLQHGGVAAHEETVRTRVTFRALTTAQVQAYVATGEGTDKAGAYAIQGRGAAFVSRLEGSYSSVVGLPACEFMLALEGLGLWG